MGSLRGAHNKNADPALTEERLSELDINFSTFRKQLTCPACFKTTTFYRNGSSNKEPFQPQFSCTSCHKAVKAFEMYPIVRSAAQNQQPLSLTTSNVEIMPPELESTTASNSQFELIKQLCQTVEQLTAELSQARSEIQDLHARQAAAARFFQPPSLNQGFKFLYIPTKARIPVGTLHTTFRKLGVNNARLLDIHYPARNTVAILIHNDYETEFTDLLRHHNITIKADFNPSSGKILADPKYSTLTTNERDVIASDLQQTRLERALDHICTPVKFAVARFFLDKQWISKQKFDSLKTDRNTQLNNIFDSPQQQSTPPSDVISYTK
ncbi:uncharacterized protein BX663DRAFT_529099 [Cokeromyces recurvatus]|uniref:uncharacterized protein n=1 Tax=Cokeromyces recurvatus TaxID=90255 RepID=UPI00221F54F6|nr:uncharacterized protein BX663DRAFT_529099 [Cokeromyces recurvatus]KAI7906273.1 hypothetical protein BX663DRAFT_529099 [Cokeromyces recurvatus]